MTRAVLVTFVAALVLTAIGCGRSSSRTSSTTQRTLTDLHSIAQLQTAFKTASGEPRLVVLVSPT